MHFPLLFRLEESPGDETDGIDIQREGVEAQDGGGERLSNYWKGPRFW